MKTRIKALFISLLVILLTVSTVLPCLAAPNSGKITVTLEDNEKNRIDGMDVHACQVASFYNDDYIPTKAFENSGISIFGIVSNPDDATAKTIFDYVKDKEIQSLSKTSENGKVTFDELRFGIWLVYGGEHDTYAFNPYLVFLPYESGGKVYVEVSSAPKVEDGSSNEISLYVIKKWDDKNNAAKKRPDSITVDLLDGNTVVATAQLSEANGWAHTFPDVPKDGKYAVREKAVADYAADYSGDAVNGFVITNTYAGEKLPQTGQHWWPILFIAVAGVCFVLLGIYEIGVKKNGKEK